MSAPARQVWDRQQRRQHAIKRMDWNGRALGLFFRLNADMLNYTPLSHKARRAARIIVKLVAAMEART